jgi:undecaprenyl diphosphate synthase
MDGNGRWAAQRGLPRTEGHRRGVESTKECVRAAADAGISYLTLFSFSSENWKRPPTEVGFLMGLLKRFIQRDLAEIHENNVKLRIIGSEDNVPPEIVKMLRDPCAYSGEYRPNGHRLQLRCPTRSSAPPALAERVKWRPVEDITRKPFYQFDTAALTRPYHPHPKHR